MATQTRNPLVARSLSFQHSPVNSPQSASGTLSSAKRARSPEPGQDAGNTSNKRVKSTDTPHSSILARDDLKKKEKDRKRVDRVDRETEFRVKYTRAFPSWVFHFDLGSNQAEPITPHQRDELQQRVIQMGARVDDFFSGEVTHLITNNSTPAFPGKENTLRNQSHPAAFLRSPIRLKGRPAEDRHAGTSEPITKKAIDFQMKVWSALKLQSVLDRCHAPTVRQSHPPSAPSAPPPPPRERSLSRLLETERRHGTTERDPAEKRSDWIYFAKGSRFVLIEDMRQELATIAAVEYTTTKGRDGKERGTWPVLHCHPLARGPFVEYDEREERRRQKADKADREREYDRQRRRSRFKDYQRRQQAHMQEEHYGDLRRTVSLSNLRRHHTLPDREQDGGDGVDEDAIASVNASGFLASGAYMAASGNSVGITSTAGTTSTASHSLRAALPANLRGRLQQQVVTSRRFTIANASSLAGKENAMGPPAMVPDRPNKLLRKSRSTNTVRLPKREEGIKPGYCESCRVKFEDFKEHVASRKHRKFAADDNNFAQLDSVLNRVRRKTLEEVTSTNRTSRHEVNRTTDEETLFCEDIQWDDWVDDDDA